MGSASSALFGLPGLRVVGAEHEVDGIFTVCAVPEAESRARGAGRRPPASTKHVMSAATDIWCGGRKARLRVHKRRLGMRLPVVWGGEDSPNRCRTCRCGAGSPAASKGQVGGELADEQGAGPYR